MRGVRAAQSGIDAEMRSAYARRSYLSNEVEEFIKLIFSRLTFYVSEVMKLLLKTYLPEALQNLNFKLKLEILFY